MTKALIMLNPVKDEQLYAYTVTMAKDRSKSSPAFRHKKYRHEDFYRFHSC
jgi:hypothetical protein